MAGEFKQCIHCQKVMYRTKEALGAWVRKTTCSQKCCNAAYAGKKREMKKQETERRSKPLINLIDPMDKWLHGYAP